MRRARSQSLGPRISGAQPETISLSTSRACPTRLHRIPRDALAVLRPERVWLRGIEAPRSFEQLSCLPEKTQCQPISVSF